MSKVILKVNSEKTELTINKKQKKEFKLLGTYRKTIDGGTLFRYDVNSKTFEKARFKTSEVFNINGANKKELVVVPNSIYVESLNLKNAIKRLEKGKIVFKS